MTIYLTTSKGTIVGTPHTTYKGAKTAINGRGEVVKVIEWDDYEIAVMTLRAIIDDLPIRRDWLDPDLETLAKAIIIKYATMEDV